ncbi:MAG: hypothetical protein ACREDR_07030, partial [Blastocatellia bacterium]
PDVPDLDEVRSRADELLAFNPDPLPFTDEASEDEVRRAWKRWLQSHHSFFFNFALLSYSYDRLLDALDTPGASSQKIWADRISALWKAGGGLMRYGCDFEPLRLIYEGRIRVAMPPAFSGFWLREWEVLRAKLPVWQNIVVQKSTAELAALDRTIKAGFGVYSEHHDYVIHAAVTNGKSLAQDYAKQRRCLYHITEADFKVYDDWFLISRVEGLTRTEFMNTACDTFRDTLIELGAGHRLATAVIEEITGGVRAGVDIFREWLVPATEGSRYYSKSTVRD